MTKRTAITDTAFHPRSSRRVVILPTLSKVKSRNLCKNIPRRRFLLGLPGLGCFIHLLRGLIFNAWLRSLSSSYSSGVMLTRHQRIAARISIAYTSYRRLFSVKKRGSVFVRRRSSTKLRSIGFVVPTDFRATPARAGPPPFAPARARLPSVLPWARSSGWDELEARFPLFDIYPNRCIMSTFDIIHPNKAVSIGNREDRQEDLQGSRR
jgi:hypothetical protein